MQAEGKKRMRGCREREQDGCGGGGWMQTREEGRRQREKGIQRKRGLQTVGCRRMDAHKREDGCRQEGRWMHTRGKMDADKRETRGKMDADKTEEGRRRRERGIQRKEGGRRRGRKMEGDEGKRKRNADRKKKRDANRKKKRDADRKQTEGREEPREEGGHAFLVPHAPPVWTDGL